MVKFLIVLLVAIIIITIFSVIGSDKKKWPAITVTSLLLVELVLCMLLHNGIDCDFIQKTTGIDIVLILLVLWIFSLTPHVETNDSKKTENDVGQNDKAWNDSGLFRFNQF